MSESSEHRALIVSMARKLIAQYPDFAMNTDLQMRPGEAMPPMVNEYRPDIYAYNKGKSYCIIGEAKTVPDLENNHTHLQMKSFLHHLESMPEGIFILGVSGEKADRAKTLLRFLFNDLALATTKLQVFDGCDYWTLDEKGGVLWHLS